jgi:hypothetical protein
VPTTCLKSGGWGAQLLHPFDVELIRRQRLFDCRAVLRRCDDDTGLTLHEAIGKKLRDDGDERGVALVELDRVEMSGSSSI